MRIIYTKARRELQQITLTDSQFKEVTSLIDNEVVIATKLIQDELKQQEELIDLLSQDEFNKLDLAKNKLRNEFLKTTENFWEDALNEWENSKVVLDSEEKTNREKTNELGFALWHFERALNRYSTLGLKNKLIILIENEILCS